VEEGAKMAMNEYEDLVILTHTDYLIDVSERRSHGETEVLKKHHLPILQKGRVNVICDHVGGETRMFTTFPLKKMLDTADYLERALDGIDYMMQEASESKESILIVTETDDFERVKKENKLGIILALQGGNPIKRDLALLRTFYRLGIRMMNLTANIRNQIADSCMDRTNGGLSEFGVSVVEEMNKLGMVIDISQLSHKGDLEVLEISKKPVIASNSNAWSICNHPRNLHDDVIKLLGENGGVIGIHCLPAFLTNDSRASLNDIVKHLEYISSLVGVDHLAVGPDLLENWPKEKYDSIWGIGQDLGNHLISFDYPEGFESIAKIPSLGQALLEHGFSHQDVGKIFGKNVLRVFKESWR
jgi:membrane dipeptidase